VIFLLFFVRDKMVFLVPKIVILEQLFHAFSFCLIGFTVQLQGVMLSRYLIVTLAQ